MTEDNNFLAASLMQAGDGLTAFASGPARSASEAIARSFEGVGARMSAALARGATSGELSLRRLAKQAITAFSTHRSDEITTARSVYAEHSASRTHGAIHIHFHLAGGVEDVRRHQGQIAAHLARAVAYGRGKM